jgi:predicted Zn finger-like uncharacterized protein
MILSCPACSTRYLLEPAALGPRGRQVRCAKCGHSWQQTPPSDMPREVDLSMPPPGTLALPENAGPRPGSRRGLGLPLLILVLLALGLSGGYFFRARIVTEWPGTAGIYELVGIPVRILGAGLELANVAFTWRQTDGATVIDVRGEVSNKTDRDITLPPLRVALSDDQDKQLSDWTFTLDRSTIAPGETVVFKTEGKNPPPAATKLHVTFAGGN